MIKYALACLCLIMSACSPYKDEGSEIADAIHQSIDQAFKKHQTFEARDQKAGSATKPNDTLPNAISLALSQPNQSKDQGTLLNLYANDMPIGTFMAMLGKQAHLNIVVSPELKERITLHLNDTSFQTLHQILEDMYPIDITKKDKHSYVVTPEKLITKTFRVAGLYIHREGTSSTNIEGSGQKNVTTTSGISTSSGNTKVVDQLTATLQSIARHKDSSININRSAGTATVTATKKDMKQIAALIADFNKASQQQVVIETKILEVQLNKEFKSGLDFSSSSTDLNFSSGSFKIYDTPRVPTGSMLPFSATIDLLGKQGQVHVLSSPRISTLNKQKALIKVGEDKYFLTQTNSSQTFNLNQGNVQNQSFNVQPFFTGIALDVTPEVLDDDNIIMHIHPLITSIKPQVISSTISGSDTTITVPATDVRESDVMVHAKNGQVVMIGGLILKRAHDQRDSLPFGDAAIPIGDNDSSQTIELVILLYPRISSPEFMIDQLKALRDSYTLGGKPDVS